MNNLYDGFRIQTSRLIEKITVDRVHECLKNYVERHEPVIVDGLFEEIRDIQDKWTNAYLRKIIGDEDIEVEERKQLSDSFGEGKVICMRFKQFLDAIDEGKLHFYLTTQGQKTKDIDEPSLMSHFLSKLHKKGDIPLTFGCMKKLIPSNINIWFGNTQEASSSGLHHDFHDNLYILLRGRKEITLFSPDQAHLMKTFGKIVKIYENGRIVYEGQEQVNADGSDKDKVKIEMLKKNIEILEKESNDTENKIEKLYDKLLDIEMSRAKGRFENEEPSSKKAKVEQSFPNSFSKYREESSLTKLKSICPSMSVSLNAGQMLFMPAGWFHEVKSLSTETDRKKSEYNGHLALNYWFHPSDTGSIDHPYKSNYWETIYENQRQYYE